VLLAGRKVSGVVVESRRTSDLLRFTVPAETPLGATTVSVVTPAGTQTEELAVEVVATPP
jgi:hypothetical protein